MYGHQFYQYPIKKRVDFLNAGLGKGQYNSLEKLAADIFIDIEDLKEELRKGGYFFVPDLNQFVRIEMGKVG
ncbi:hypothetical protein P4U99_22825 [Brevibacillus agri]|uniref:hypothetical protein n=1 Tax=Brevibacillus TaxID=55080 RepID=UPI001562724A|nr:MULTISPECIES: hypothetical protein [Brevibacillus]MBE5393699.1 hypothetical protein [Brevibacillus borstelensis]MED1645985.1 hypothetical protein [Brevibacillus agri]MED1656298.1 hypothetical protein [Brevibacillus agri]MED1689220.1 hypothetical protein [Brevibacillus agri]MED1693743.1 hypothetical protein [Brevibacillus agri]